MVREVGSVWAGTSQAARLAAKDIQRRGFWRASWLLRYSIVMNIAASTKRVLPGIPDAGRNCSRSYLVNLSRLHVLEPEFCTSTDTRRILVTVLGMVAEMERRFILKHQRVGIDTAKKNGVYKGRKPSVPGDLVHSCFPSKRPAGGPELL
jgi:hypothetical protein